jgi:hypothetical protein
LTLDNILFILRQELHIGLEGLSTSIRVFPKPRVVASVVCLRLNAREVLDKYCLVQRVSQNSHVFRAQLGSKVLSMEDEVLANLSLERVHFLLLNQLFISVSDTILFVLHYEHELVMDFFAKVDLKSIVILYSDFVAESIFNVIS